MPKTSYAIVCRECQEEYEVRCSFNDLQILLLKEPCTKCGGLLRQSFLGGGHYTMATGATRRPT